AALLPQYQDEKLSNPEILRLSRLVTIVRDASLPRGVSCLMTLETASGGVYKSQVDHPRGSIANPMTAEEMSGKVHMLADPVIGRAAVAAAGEAVRNVETLPRIDELARLFGRPVGGAATATGVPTHA